MTDIVQIKARLESQARSVAERLYPNGRLLAGEWCVGSIHGEKGESLKIRVSGDKTGVWKDFATDDGGDLIDLWCAAQRVELPEALDQIRDWLGIERPRAERPVEKTYATPPKPKCNAPKGRVRDYLTEERNIPEEILARYKIGEDGENIIYPFLLPDGSLAMAKRREARPGATPKPTAKDCRPVLFGWQAIPSNAREVVITEGENDAMAWAAYGYPALSVPFGGGGGNKQQWIEHEFERLSRFERIYLAMDMDEPGDQAVEEIIKRLGRVRCLRVKMPHKDGNDCLMEGVPQEVMDRCIADAVSMDPEGLRRPTEYEGKVVSLFWPKEGEHVGYQTPYDRLRDQLHFRPAEVTLWTGDTGDGKSQILSDCVPDWIQQGSRVCMSSLEMKPAQTMKRMVKQIVGTDRPTEAAIGASLAWASEGLLLYELVGKSKVGSLLEVFSYARAKYGCDQFIIDSLMRLGIAADDYNGQEEIIYRLVDWTLENEVHTHLVAHARKGEKDRGAPGAQDVKGAMEVGGNAFNIISIWRNRKLEDQIQAAEFAAKGGDAAALAALDDLRKKPGVVMNVAKQRNGDFEGKIGLWFDQQTYRYHSAHDRGSWGRRYLPQDWSTAA